MYVTTPFERTITFSRASSSSGRAVGSALDAAAAFSALLDAHYPAARELSLGLQKRTLRLECLEQMRPEMQPQDVALIGEQVVADVQPRHGFQVRAHDPIDDEAADCGGVVAAVFEIVQDGGADRQSRPASPSYHSVTFE